MQRTITAVLLSGALLSCRASDSPLLDSIHSFCRDLDFQLDFGAQHAERAARSANPVQVARIAHVDSARVIEEQTRLCIDARVGDPVLRGALMRAVQLQTRRIGQYWKGASSVSEFVQAAERLAVTFGWLKTHGDSGDAALRTGAVIAHCARLEDRLAAAVATAATRNLRDRQFESLGVASTNIQSEIVFCLQIRDVRIDPGEPWDAGAAALARIRPLRDSFGELAGERIGWRALTAERRVEIFEQFHELVRDFKALPLLP